MGDQTLSTMRRSIRELHVLELKTFGHVFVQKDWAPTMSQTCLDVEAIQIYLYIEQRIGARVKQASGDPRETHRLQQRLSLAMKACFH